jgi:hypothetical protein
MEKQVSTATITANPVVLEGETVLAFDIPLYPQYAGKTAVVTAISGEGSVLHGEFQSIEKPDDTINLAFNRWYEPFTRETLVGVRVRAIEVQGYERLNGQEFEVTEVHPSTRTDWTQGLAVKGFLDDRGTGRDLWVVRWEPVGGDVTPERMYTTAEYEGMRNRYEAQVAQYNLLDTEYRNAIDTISTRMNEEANNRGWCSEFNRIIGEVNADLGRYELQGGERDYTVDWNETYTVTVRRSATFTARDADHAIELAGDYETASSYDLRDAVDNGNYSFDEADDYEAEED